MSLDMKTHLLLYMCACIHVHVCVCVCVCAVLVAQSGLTLRPPWTVTCQAPLFMGFFRQEYGSEFPFPTPGDISDAGIEPTFPALQADFFTI